MGQKKNTLNKVIYLTLVLVMASGGLAFAETRNSTNYTLDEDFIGIGGLIESNSSNYSSNESIGDIGGGDSNSSSYQSSSGYTTTGDPALTVAVTSSSVNFGQFSTATTKTGTTTFNVKNYTTYGYVVQIIGAPPTNSSYTLEGMTGAPASSAVGTEQFGINLVANTAPATFGADPVQIPDSSFSFGAATSNYNQTNKYRFVSGETIAQATKNSGQTDYTISYIVNVSSLTPGGSYSGAQQIVVVGTY